MSAAETADCWVQDTPMLDPDIVRKDAHVHPRPGNGLQHTIGAVKIFDSLGMRKRQLPDEFVPVEPGTSSASITFTTPSEGG